MIIREAIADDSEVLKELEEVSPEEGSTVLKRIIKDDYFQLAQFLHPVYRIYVAQECERGKIIGVLNTARQKIKLERKIVPACYFFRLRVHPSYRRQGVASALIRQAEKEVRESFGAKIFYCGIIEGNKASLTTFLKNGYKRLDEIKVKILFPKKGDSLSRNDFDVDYSSVATSEINKFLDYFYCKYNFWPPKCSTMREVIPDPPTGFYFIRDKQDRNILALTHAFDPYFFEEIRPTKVPFLLSVASKFFPSLPKVGDSLRFAFLNDFAFTDKKAALFLLSFIRKELNNSIDIFLIPQYSSLNEVVKKNFGFSSKVSFLVKAEKEINDLSPPYFLRIG